MITGETWNDLVPKEVFYFIKNIGGEERLKEIVGTDKR
jgi:nicotinamide-nucleotide adenylyltransferase